MSDLAINLLASVIAGVAVWLFQRLIRLRRAARLRAFFGFVPGANVLLVVGKHASSTQALSVNKADMSAIVELAVLAKSGGTEPTVVLHGETLDGVGEQVEFCVGGPDSNARTAAHLRWLLPGVSHTPYDEDPEGLTLRVGPATYRRERDSYEYVLVARVAVPGGRHPLFVICGQTAATNHAAARYLARKRETLLDQHGSQANFCLVLRIVGRGAYGNSFVEPVADVTADAFTQSAPDQGAGV
ncbi:hypothetical protein [Actinoplanes sp. NPDC049118]|uniref:hypothetical protein n=1 Tax=Actinoplanes sp. NPDC049118 TaxID=3155769 RepID=UPI0033FACE6E